MSQAVQVFRVGHRVRFARTGEKGSVCAVCPSGKYEIDWDEVREPQKTLVRVEELDLEAWQRPDL